MTKAKSIPKKLSRPLSSLFLSPKESARRLTRNLAKGGERVLVAAHIFDLRMKAGWSQRELAERAAVGFRTLQRVETDPVYSPSLEVLSRLGKALGVPVERFLKKTDLRKLYGF